MQASKKNKSSNAAIKQDGIEVKGRSFVAMTLVLLIVLLFAGMLTRTLPLGSYERTVDVSGNETIIPGSYTTSEFAERLPVWRWFTAPLEVFTSSENLNAIVIIVFLLMMGGVFLVLDRCGVMRHMLWTLNRRFKNHRYGFMAVMVLISMLMGSTAGLFEETVVFVPISVALALSFGWDSLTGLGMSILAVNFGFAVGLFNPFSLVVSQKIAGLRIYSGAWLRVATFAVVYGILMLFLWLRVRQIEKNPERSLTKESDSKLGQRYLYDVNYNPFADTHRLSAAMIIFLFSFLPILAYIIASILELVSSDYVLPVMIVSLMLGGLIAGTVARYEKHSVARDFFAGMLKILPAMLPIIMAMSVKIIITEGGVLDTILHSVYEYTVDISPYYLIAAVYVFLLVLELFMSSASSKAALALPLLLPLTDMAGISRQSTVLTYLFADGFPNMIMPTNACLLIVLGIAGVSYGKWVRWSLPLQLVVFAVTMAISVFSVYIGYGAA